jgi:hypothetical protein
MKLKHDVKYLTTTVAILLSISSTVSTAQVSNIETDKSGHIDINTHAAEVFKTALAVEPTENVSIPALTIEPPVESEKTIEETVKVESSTAQQTNEPMPLIENKMNSYIPLVEDAIIFANLDGELPAVVNYYTIISEQEIIDFYQLSFGEVLSQERKRDRLTLTFQDDTLMKRVVISQQNDKHQVDVIVEQLPK